MKRQVALFLMLVMACESWSTPKPMESVENYNVLLIHGAYGSDQGFLSGLVDSAKLGEAYYAAKPLDNGAQIGRYDEAEDAKTHRLLYWLGPKIFEENYPTNQRESRIYQYRSFSNPANSSDSNAVELGNRMWHLPGTPFSKRRAMIEEAQEVKATVYDSIEKKYIYGQVALDSMRKNPDLYRQLASRYILIGHSMGGVVSREWIQNSNYYHGEVDKVITLDSPHEGTGALNMQLDLANIEWSIGELGVTSLASVGLFYAGSYGPVAKTVAISSVLWSMMGGFVNVVAPAFILGNLQNYKKTDPLVEYVDPRKKGKGHIDYLKDIEPHDSLPMFRLLGGDSSITFTDPYSDVTDIIGMFFVPEMFLMGFSNLFSQLTSDENEGFLNSFAMASKAGTLGILSHVSARDQGTNLVSKSSGWATGTKSLNDPMVDVKRFRFNAAPESDWEAWRGLATGTEIVVLSCVAIDVALSWFPAAAKAANFAAALGSSFMLYNMATSLLGEDLIKEVSDSHNLPIWAKTLDDLRKGTSSYSRINAGDTSWSPYLMEDFLYERPFVNLALNDSRTMELLAQDSSLNPNCYFESDSMQNVPLCEVGLYGARDSVIIDSSVVKDSQGQDSVRYDTTHIYNAVAERLDSIGNVVRDSSGKVVYDSVYYGTFEQRNYSDFRNSPLNFKSESDWYKVGVKVDRWERVDGLKPNGDLAPKGVPIRHVERYSVPDIVATGFIEKYSFVVDDLMPHRMRQIKMTFNSNEEVAWECDITKAEGDPTACDVYRRFVGDAWKPIFVKDTVVVTDSTGKPKKEIIDVAMKVPHPIKKNGRFDFDARKYFGNLANIQKDNQNTVVISMVNKIGLSNTQRFYYLFKATDNMLKPTWPQHDVVLNAIDGFKAYVSALDYQGFRVHGANDEFFRDSLDNYVVRFGSLDMGTAIAIGNNGSEYVFASKRKDLNPAEGEYRWVVSTNISNKELKNPSEPDSSKTDSYEVHFKVDRTAPAFTLTSDAMMNPDSSMFITRFKWAGKDSADKANGSDIRVMRWTLEKATGQLSGGSATSFTKYAELPALYDVASNEFAIAWDKVPQGKRDSMGNGLYRIAAYAIDYAVPNLDAYHKVNALVDSIFSNPTNLSDSLWNRIDSLGLNDTTIYVEFRVDSAAPVFTFRETRAVTAADTVNYGTYVNLSGKYDVLRKNAPSRDSSWTYVSRDSLLQIGYTVMDTLNGLDSAAVTVGWNFVHIPDTNVIDRAGDSVWVFDSLGGSTSGTWTEMAGLRMADGEYSVRAVLRDGAKNVRHDVVPKRVRVDRTAPQIVGLTSDHLVYMDKDGDFSATILLSENADIGVNRTGMHCSYRVLGGSDTSWHETRKGERKLLANDTVKFSIAKTSIGTDSGIRYLEAACVDAAGNVSVRTDLFHVGARFPQITYPQPDTIQSEQSFIPIVGIAPKTSSADSLSSVYRLRYRIDNDTTWRTDKVRVVAANRSTSADNISRISQATEGVLGYLENDGFGSEAEITVELAIASCETCNDWAAVTTNFVVVPPDADYNKPLVEFAITRNGSDVNTFKTGDGPVDISVRLKNKFNSNYMLRVYAEDSVHRGIFDVLSEKVFYNPYYGTPTAAADTAIWFYEKDGKYHLAWKNLDKINLKVGYNSAKFGETCKSADANQSLADGCSTELSPIDFSSIANAANAYLADYPEWMPPAYIDSTMTITKDSGEVVLESSEAFRVYVERKDATDTAALNIPVYFGESTKPGFYWVKHVDSLVSPLMTGWTVNPNAYGLDYRWDGIATSGAYPSGDITLYAEVTENILDNPFVSVVTKTLKVEQNDVELVVPKSLPDYIALKVVDPNMVVVDDSNKVAYMRDSMKVFFGLKNGDAHVKISVLDSSKKPFRTLLDSILSAHTGDSAYFVTWDGKDSLGNVQSVGAYYIKFESPSNAFKAKTVPFEMKLRNGLLDETPKDPKTSNLGFYVAEAKKVADDVYRYEPYADYLVDVQMKGWYLPNSRRYDRFDVTGNVSGSQKILGFRPERFSLGIKRHRDTLEMIVVSKLHNKMVNLDKCNGTFWNECEKITKADVDHFKLDTAVFTGNNKTKLIVYDYGKNNYGFLQFDSASAYLDVVACSKKLWKEYGKSIKTKEDVTKDLFDSLKRLCEWNIENVLERGQERYPIPDPGRCVEAETIWDYPDSLYVKAAEECNEFGLLLLPSLRNNLSFPPAYTYLPDNVDSCMAKYLCPSRGFETVYRTSNNKDVGCQVDSSSGYLDSVCVKSDKQYNPNLRLFNVTFTPSPYTNRFFSNWKTITDYNRARFWSWEFFSMTLEIPDSYWNAPFGMDNLVNRTIRFDHTNKTIFNENGKDGYWNAVEENFQNSDSIAGYFDGNKWSLMPNYGLLTPYEVQHLIFFPVSILESSNAFNFDDESKDFMYSSSFELKFYGHDTTTHHFEAKIIGDRANPLDTSGCIMDASKFVMQTGASHPCQIRVTSEGPGIVKTPVFTHGNVHFFVGMNRLWSETDTENGMSIPYPADSATWRKSIGNICSDSASYTYFKKMAQGDKDSVCYKYYGSGSRVHYYFSDYSDSLWKSHFLTDSLHYFRNYVNSPGKYFTPKSLDDTLANAKKVRNGKDFTLSYFLNPDDYIEGNSETEPGRFFIRLDSLKKIKEEYKDAGITLSSVIVSMKEIRNKFATFDSLDMNLYINAESWTERVLYRRTIDTSKAILERPDTRTLPLRDIYTFRIDPLSNNCDKSLYCKIDTVPELLPNPWIKNAVVDTARLLQVDSTEHPVLEISTARDSSDRIISFKDAVVARPPELIEIRGKNLTHDRAYTLSFLNNSTYYLIRDTLKYDTNCVKNFDGSCHLAWFNVNKLQGHTQFLLTWGGDSPTNAMHFNMYVGSNVKPENNGVVKSMYGELSVTFPQGSIEKPEDFTVRTVNVQKDYGFNVFKDMALTGPVMEVLPSMTFKDTTKLPRIQMKISRQQMVGMNVTPQTLRLYKVDFKNKQFVPLENSLYSFLDGLGAPIMDLNGTDTLTCSANVETSPRCTGKQLAWEYVLISAETRTFSVFVAMDTLAAFVPDTSQEELPAIFACRVPQDSLWLGTDNGYLAYGASCNHPGYGTLSLYQGSSLVAEVQGEIPDTIKYNGKRLVGGSVVGSIPDGIYESRYVGYSSLGENLQLAGPAVRTDSARPVINAFEVLSGEDVLDRVFTVRANVKDVESGVARVVVSSTLGNDPRAPIELVPDSLGNVTGVIRLTRSELAKCSGCKLSLEMRAEDFGHNHTESAYESGKLYQYPTKLALWYPFHEGMGRTAYEYVGTGHDLNLGGVASPWLGDAGMYFSKLTDLAAGIGRVDFGTSQSYSFEAKIRNGNITNPGWLRVLGFKGIGGLDMELRVHGRKLQLVEGDRVWSTDNNVLPVQKEWAHVVVTVDSSEVRFYVNGELMKSKPAEPMERELDGVFSVGADNGNSFIGHIADVRMYGKALSDDEVLALSQPVSDEGEIVEIVTIPMTTVNGEDGFAPEFSCSVAGNRYFESARDGARLSMDAYVEKAGKYRVMMYARSAGLATANVSVLPSPEMRYTGTVTLSPVWKTVAVSDVSVNLSAGMHTVTLEAPEGLQVAGFALVTANVPATSIAWNSGLENPERKVKTYVRYVGFDDKKVLQPRVRLRNVSNTQINGYSVRYYFRGEESSLTRPHAYYPYNDTTGLAVHSESDRTGYVEWNFNNGVIPIAGTVFNGDGPHFGVHYEDWTPWNPYDDPSFVENAINDFVEDNGIIVLDSDKRLIGGSCVEMEDSVSVEVRARVYAAETRNDNSASEFQIKVENVGNVTLKNYDVRYYFFLEGGLAPEFNTYNLPDGVSAAVENIGEGRWQVSLHASEPLVSGGSWNKIAQIALHCENWNDIWNASDDPSRIGLGRDMVEAVGVNVFDSLGNRIYGDEPVWPEIVHVASPADSSDVPDYGLRPKDDGVPIHRTDDGLVIELPQYTNISLSLVNVFGTPIKSLYSGTLAPGSQFVHVDWTGIDVNRTYLLLRVNGAIRSTKLLSLL